MATVLPVRATIVPLGNKSGLAQVQFHGWSGWIPSLQATPDRYRRIGESGTGSQSTGLQGAMVTCNGWRGEINLDNVFTTIAAIELLQNEVVRIVDAWNRTLPRCRIWRASAVPTKAKGPLISGNSTATHRVTVSLDIERLPDA